MYWFSACTSGFISAGRPVCSMGSSSVPRLATASESRCSGRSPRRTPNQTMASARLTSISSCNSDPIRMCLASCARGSVVSATSTQTSCVRAERTSCSGSGMAAMRTGSPR
ncbi:hypothetical protein D3C72_834950 [compost metagenome]